LFRLSPYALPKINIIIGLFFGIMNGAMMPIFGFLLIKTLFSMFTVDKEKMYDETMNWILIMALLSVA